MKRLFLGLTDVQFGSEPYTSRPTGWWWGMLYPSLYTGKITEIEIFSNSSGTCQVGIYEGANPPESVDLLEGLNTDQSVIGGQWNSLILNNPLDAIETNLYTLAVCKPSTSGVVTSKNVGDNTSYYYWNYTGNLPDPSLANLYDYWGIYAENRKIIFRANGYIPPTLNSITGGNVISIGSTGVALNGTDLTDYELTGQQTDVYITNHATWGSETIKVQQTFVSGDDDALLFDYSDPSLELGGGTWYIHTETGLGQNTGNNGLEVEIVEKENALPALIGANF